MTTPSVTFEVFTLFPEAILSFASAGLLGRAVRTDLVEIRCTNFRDFATDRYGTVDDAPFGGGAGMVIKPEPVAAALDAVEAQRGPMHRILLTPSAPRFDQAAAERLARMDRIGLICGRYEGIDDRIREHFVDECFSLGDFVLNGGEVAALVIIEAVSRLHEGVIGNPSSAALESFAERDGGSTLEHPHYTRPAVFRGHSVPKVLLGGDHEAIARWRREQSLSRTWAIRPDLRRARAFGDRPKIHLVVPATEIERAAAWADLCRARGLGELLVLGDVETSTLWSAAVGGRTQISVFRDPAALKRRLRRAYRLEPRIIRLLANPSGGSARTASELCDRLDLGSQGKPPPLVLAVDLEAQEGAYDAVFAPARDFSPPGNLGRDPELALASPAVIDESAPPFATMELVDRALAQLSAIWDGHEPTGGGEGFKVMS